MPDDGRDARRARTNDDRQAAEVQAPGPLLGGPGEDGQLIASLRALRRGTGGVGAPANGRLALVAVGAVSLAVAAGGCGEDFTREAAIESFREANEEATEQQAACVVDGLVARYGLDDLESQLAAEPLDAGFEEDQFREMFVCGVAGDWRDEIADQLVANGVAADDAPCVADELFATMTDDDIDVLLSGDITESFAEKFTAALESCDALNP